MPRTSGSRKPSTKSAPPTDCAADARQRLLEAGLALFAEHGFTGTSTRAIAQAAGVNVAAIRYYFGDKQGLYRAAFVEPMGTPQESIPHFTDPGAGLREALEGFFRTFIDPLRRGDVLACTMKLHLREMLDRSTLWEVEIEKGIIQAHEALAQVLIRHLRLRKADDELHRLVFAITALGVQTIMGKDLCMAIRPSLINKPAALDLTVRRLADYAIALVRSEATRRRATSTRNKKP